MSLGNEMNAAHAETLGFHIHKTSSLLKNELGRRLKPFGITVEQWRVLKRLWQEDGLSQKELADQILKDQPNTARILDKLQCKGIIKRVASPADRRCFMIFLTEEGRGLRERLLPVAATLSGEAFASLNEAQQGQLEEFLRQICANIGRQGG